jgi:hypothetical protein
VASRRRHENPDEEYDLDADRGFFRPKTRGQLESRIANKLRLYRQNPDDFQELSERVSSTRALKWAGISTRIRANKKAAVGYTKEVKKRQSEKSKAEREKKFSSVVRIKPSCISLSA